MSNTALFPSWWGVCRYSVTLDALDKNALRHILTDPKNALTKQYAKLFEYDGVELEFTPGALDAIAEKTMERSTGARGLRSIMEGIMTDIMYRVPSDPTIVKVVITEDTVKNAEQPQVVTGMRAERRDVKPAARSERVKS